MTIPTFVAPMSPSPGTTDTPEVRVLKAAFGDGYTQDAADGMNNVRRVLSLKWDVLTQSDADSIISFMTALGGWQPFYYRFTGEATTLLWTCETFATSYAAVGYRAVTATFRQCFNVVAS